jgi:hypothetical protein
VALVRRRARRSTVALVASVAISAGLVAGCNSRPPEPLEKNRAGGADLVLTDPRISESSGLALSRVHPDTLYTHNDLGTAPEIFAVSAESGETEAVFLLDTTPVDWEDIAVTESGIWVGDIGGGEGGERETVSVLFFPEPEELEDGSPKFTKYQLTYEDGAHNAEALLVRPDTDQVYVVTKDGANGGIYEAPSTLKSGNNVLRRLGQAPPNITAGAWASSGSTFALRNYVRAFVYEEFGADPIIVDLPRSRQGESLEFLPDGDLLVGTEGSPSPVDRVEVPSPTPSAG